MMVLRQKYSEFRFGFMIHSVCFEAHFGWVGVMILWSKAS